MRQVLARDVGVDLGRGDVGVAEQGLDDPKVRAAFQQVGGEGVAQDVGADLLAVDAGGDGRIVQQLPHPPRRQPGPNRRAGNSQGLSFWPFGRNARRPSR